MTATLKKNKPWKDELRWARIICEPLGCVVDESPHAYEIATVKGEGVQLVIYPHTVSGTGNQHARVRNNGSKDKDLAKRVMRALDEGEGLPEKERWRVKTFCTFKSKNDYSTEEN